MTTIPEYLRPLHSNLLVRVDPRREKIGSLYVPEVSQREVGTGTVVAIGPGRVDTDGKRDEMEIKIGDRVAYEVFRAIEKLEEDAPVDPDNLQRSFELETTVYTLIQQRHVLGVLEDEKGDEQVEVNA